MEDLHNPNGISQDICVSVISCPGSMHTLSMSFANTMPAWTKSKFFNPENERKRETCTCSRICLLSTYTRHGLDGELALVRNERIAT